jgi:hypothetical protein
VLIEQHLITEVSFTVAGFKFIESMDELVILLVVVLLELDDDEMAVEVEDCNGAKV